MFNKTLIAAAIAAMAISGTANAAISNNNGGEMFLVAYDSTSQNTFVATLDSWVSSASTAITSTLNMNLASNAGTSASWAAFTGAAGYNAATTSYQVLGVNTTSGNLWNTSADLNTAAGAPMLGSQYNAITSPTGSFTTWLGYYAASPVANTSSAAFVAGGATNGSETQILNNWANNEANFTTTNALGSSMAGYKIQYVNPVYNGRTLVSPSTTVASATGVNWTLNGNGTLVAAVAAVPEADTWAMMVAGLGLVGLIARRRVGA